MAQPSYEQLLHIIADKDRQLARQQARIDQLEIQVRQLTAQPQAVLTPPSE
jgi:cell division protein FtsB